MKYRDIIIIIATLFILHFFVWLRPGLLLGGGEAGLLFSNPEEMSTITQYAWVNKTIGNATGIVVSTHPTMWAIAQLVKMGIPNEVVQAIFFFLINVTGSTGIYLLVKRNISNSGNSAIFASLFYVFNLSAMTIIWNRFQYTYMVFYGCIPLVLYLYSTALQKNKSLYALLTIFSLAGMNFAFASLPLVELAALVLAFYSLFFFITQPKVAQTYYSLLKINLIVGVGSLGINLWWFIQFFEVLKTSSYITSQAYTSDGNLSTLLTLSNSLGNMSFVIRMMHKDFFSNMNEIWGGWYAHPIGIVFTYFPAFIAFSTLLIKQKPKIIYFFVLWSLFVLFVMKGAHTPFGYIFTYLFSNVRVLEAFRNPFEKFSILLPLGYAPLIGYAINEQIIKYQNPIHKKIFISLVSFVLFIIVVFPIWNRWVFTSNMSPSNNLNIGDYVKVPSYYKDLNNWLNNDKDQFRTVFVPFGGEGIRQKWDYGYLGVELSMELLHKPSISLSTNLEFLQPIADQVQDLIMYNPNSLNAMMQLTNTKYIMTRSDVDLKTTKFPDGEIVSKVKNNKELKKTAEFDKVEVYSTNSFDSQSKIYATKGIISVPEYEQYVFSNILPYSNYQKGDTFIPETQIPKDIKEKAVKESIISARQLKSNERITENLVTYIPFTKPIINKENALIELPHVSVLPNSWKYQFINLKEQWELNRQKGTDKDFYQMRETGKRLVEISKLYDIKADSKLIKKISDIYYHDLKEIKYEYIYNFVGVRSELLRHQSVIQQLLTTYPAASDNESIKKSNSYLDDLFTNGIPTNSTSDIKYIKRDFDIPIPDESQYKLLIAEIPSEQSGEIPFSINGINSSVKLNSFSDISQLKKGENKIRFSDDDSRSIGQKGLVERVVVAKKTNPSYQIQETPEISIQKINPSLYTAEIINAQNPYILVFSESYHPLWEIKINNKAINAPHFLANSFANGWYIEEKGNYSIQIKFRPQDTLEKYTKLSKFVGIIILISIAIILAKEKIIRGKHE